MAKKIPMELSLLNEWTERLGLQDWAIVLHTDCNPSEMSLQGALGCTSWQEATKTAVIQIVNPNKVDGLTRPYNFEEILIHELLHLKTSLLSSGEEPETTSDRVLHQLVDDIARAFIDTKNSVKKNEKRTT